MTLRYEKIDKRDFDNMSHEEAIEEIHPLITSSIMSSSIPDIRDNRPIINRVSKKEIKYNKEARKMLNSYMYDLPCGCKASGYTTHIHTGRFNEYMLYIGEKNGSIKLCVYDSLAGDKGSNRELFTFPTDVYVVTKTVDNKHIFISQVPEHKRIYEIYHPLLNRTKREAL